MITSKAIYQQRLNTCHACPYYVTATRSCGTLITGGTVTDGGHTFKLCGCFIDAKAAIAVQSCPAGKWGNELSREEKIAMLAYLDRVWGNRQLTDQDRKELQQYTIKLTGSPADVLKGSCSSCGGAIVEWMNKTRQELKKSITENAPAPPVEYPPILESSNSAKNDIHLENEIHNLSPDPLPESVDLSSDNPPYRIRKTRKHRK